MMKYPKFLIVQNRLADTEGVYIYHGRKPRFLAKIEGSAFEIIDDIDSMIEYYGGNMSKVEGLFNRMRDWYKIYKRQDS